MVCILYSVCCTDVHGVQQLAQMDSVEELQIWFFNNKLPAEIVLKNPKYLKYLSIECKHPEDVYIKDSLINLTSISIEGKFTGELNVKCRPDRIHAFSAFSLKSSDFTFLEKFSNLDTLSLGFVRNEDKLFATLSHLKSLKYLWMHKKSGEIQLGDEFSSLSTLGTVKGNIRFDENNINRLNTCTQLTSVIFTLVKISKIPGQFAALTSRKRVVVAAPNMKRQGLRAEITSMGAVVSDDVTVH